jgi:hypothetical protein
LIEVFVVIIRNVEGIALARELVKDELRRPLAISDLIRFLMVSRLHEDRDHVIRSNGGQMPMAAILH